MQTPRTTMKQPGIFVTGTNTEVGKTYVTALLARALRDSGLRVGVYKPVASGCIQRHGKLVSEDAETLWAAAGKPETLAAVTPQLYSAALAPNLAAQAEGKVVDVKLLRSGLQAWRSYDLTLVEGVGGLMSPISDEDLVVDLAVELGMPLLVVVANELGCIHQTLQCVEVARVRGLQVAGIVLNTLGATPDLSCASNRREIQRWTDVPIVADVERAATHLDVRKLQGWLPGKGSLPD